MRFSFARCDSLSKDPILYRIMYYDYGKILSDLQDALLFLIRPRCCIIDYDAYTNMCIR